MAHATSPQAPAQGLSAADDERAAIALIVGFYACLDQSDGPGCADCFMPDGVWERDTGPVTGRAAVEAAVNGRAAHRRTVHTVMNFRFQQQAADRATLHFILVAYDAVVDDPATTPPGRCAGIRLGADHLEKTGDRWLIRRKTSTPAMRGFDAR